MPYKRRLHLLLLAPAHPEWAVDARVIAAEIGTDRIEARAAAKLGTNEANWADLVLTLEAAARDQLPELPPRVQVRNLDLARTTDAPARQAVLEERLRGILGGLRMMERGGSDY